MTQIQYRGGKAPPSWSWMAYTGKIDYLVWDLRLEWNTSVTFDDGRIKAYIMKLEGYKVETKDTKHVLQDGRGCEIGDLWYDDCEIRSMEDCWCTIIGRQYDQEDTESERDGRSLGELGKKYYILIVVKSAPASINSFYQRVGTGIVAERCILFEDMERVVSII